MLAVINIRVNLIFLARLFVSLDKIFCTRCEKTETSFVFLARLFVSLYKIIKYHSDNVCK